MAPPPVSGPSGAAWLPVKIDVDDGEVAVAHVDGAALAVVPPLRAGRRRGRNRLGRRRLAVDQRDVLQRQPKSVACQLGLSKLRIRTAPPPSSVIRLPPSITVFLLIGSFSVAVTGMVTAPLPQSNVMTPPGRRGRLSAANVQLARCPSRHGRRIGRVGRLPLGGNAGAARSVGVAGAACRGRRTAVPAARAAATAAAGRRQSATGAATDSTGRRAPPEPAPRYACDTSPSS